MLAQDAPPAAPHFPVNHLSMLERIPIAFLAGLVSVITPCVLPLVPGYLSAVSAVEANHLGERGMSRRIVLASVPFIIGFTVVFVALGAGAAAIGGYVNAGSRNEIAGFVLVLLGLAFMGLLPWPERMVAPGLLEGARRSGSSALLGAAFAVCAAPCIGTVLASILVLAGDAATVTRGAVLLLAYSIGIACAFVLAGIAFARAMSAFRWLRDHYGVIRVASGATLVALGLLLFFHRDWWLRVMLNRMLESVGLSEI
jgi:cytochrome c-type biogenesis protein